MVKVPAPGRPAKAPLHQLPHDADAIVEFEGATLSSSLKASMAFVYAFFLAFVSLIYLSYPSGLTAIILLLLVVSTTWVTYHFVFRR